MRNLRYSSTYRSFATTVSQLKICDFLGEILKVLKCYNFLWVQRRHNCFPWASFANCITTIYLLKAHLQTFPSTLMTKKMLNFVLWHSSRKWAIYFTLARYVGKLLSLRYRILTSESTNLYSSGMGDCVKHRCHNTGNFRLSLNIGNTPIFFKSSLPSS